MASGAEAVWLDRSDQNVTDIFENGNAAELAIGKVLTDNSGEDANFGGSEYDVVSDDFTNASASEKMFLQRLFSALILDQPKPIGAAISHEGSLASTALGTMAGLDSRANVAVDR